MSDSRYSWGSGVPTLSDMAWGRRKIEEAPIDVAERLLPYDDAPAVDPEPFVVDGLAAVNVMDATPAAPHSLLAELRLLSDV